MKMTGNTILITGGATGIGFSLAKAFLALNNQVIICGRREEKLLEAQNKYPNLHIKVCDVADESSRKALLGWVTENYRDINIVINNAGIQQHINLKEEIKEMTKIQNEIKINLEAPIYLSSLFVPYLRNKKDAAIINVSSGLAITPISVFPVYCATKAAVHTFTKCLRHQLAQTEIKVYEILPPAVESELNMEYRKTRNSGFKGMKSDEYVDYIMKCLEADQYEIFSKMTENLGNSTLNDIDTIFKRMNP